MDKDDSVRGILGGNHTGVPWTEAEKEELEKAAGLEKTVGLEKAEEFRDMQAEYTRLEQQYQEAAALWHQRCLEWGEAALDWT